MDESRILEDLNSKNIKTTASDGTIEDIWTRIAIFNFEAASVSRTHDCRGIVFLPVLVISVPSIFA